ncbi:hypothetical protein DFH08DRAFT_907165 [Mycena albidolilacea]|uniref:Uncharacterized protein n=1 Tax=Mycena albidolilacea TaxID=1033008 RepID=A0AAD7E7L9_9AGAR|nr:hypothetical protein DFH08DRAFT_907165 [Mycena albidolilacea]
MIGFKSIGTMAAWVLVVNTGPVNESAPEIYPVPFAVYPGWDMLSPNVGTCTHIFWCTLWIYLITRSTNISRRSNLWHH